MARQRRIDTRRRGGPRTALALRLAPILALILALPAGAARAWSTAAHQAIGRTADALLAGSAAAREIAVLLPEVDLEHAAVWADCVRNVRADDGFAYRIDPRRRDPQCAAFESPSGIAAMTDFARRNNSNCDHAGKPEHCHRHYHYADLPVGIRHYRGDAPGADHADVVHAVRAALTVLRGQKAAPPFVIENKTEALRLLAHMVGDLHQPLHLAAIYLDGHGRPLQPGAGGINPATSTAGGNRLRTGRHGDLHGEWDAIAPALARADLRDEAAALPPTEGPVEDWPRLWADDTLAVAAYAFRGLRFAPAETDEASGRTIWRVRFDDRRRYVEEKRPLQHAQIVKAAARLAAVLRAVWPEPAPTPPRAALP